MEIFSNEIPPRESVIYPRYYIESLAFCNLEERTSRVRCFRLECWIGDHCEDLLSWSRSHFDFVEEFVVSMFCDV